MSGDACGTARGKLLNRDKHRRIGASLQIELVRVVACERATVDDMNGVKSEAQKLKDCLDTETCAFKSVRQTETHIVKAGLVDGAGAVDKQHRCQVKSGWNQEMNDAPQFGREQHQFAITTQI